MKKFMFFTLFLLANIIPARLHAQEQSQSQEELEFFNMFDINENENATDNSGRSDEDSDSKTSSDTEQSSSFNFLKKYFQDSKKAKEAQSEAEQLLKAQPMILELRDSQKRLIQQGKQKRRQLIKDTNPSVEDNLTDEVAREENNEKIKQEIEQIAQEYDDAPFGLFWGVSKEQTELLGFSLQSAERTDYQNVYKVNNPKQNAKTFETVTAIFGEQDKLWCIFAQSAPQNDTPQASEVLKLYRQYYDALELKYGNARQYYTPYTYTEDIISDDKSNMKRVTKTNPIGNDRFLEELRNGTAVLYATFENDKVGITLGVSVDGDSRSYISLDYKNLKIMDEEKKAELNNLINDI